MIWLGLSIVALSLVAAGWTGGRRAHRAAGGRFVGVRSAVLLSLALLAAAAPLVSRSAGSPRAIVGFVVLLLAPGAALLGFAAIRDPLTELALAFAASLTILALSSLVMALTGGWHPGGLSAVLALASAPVVAWHGGQSAHGGHGGHGLGGPNALPDGDN